MTRFSPKRLPSPAMAVAFVALLAALSGTAIALPGKNTVDSGDIRKGSVKPSDIARNAVRGAKVKNNSLTGSDVKKVAGADVTNDSLTGSDLNEGTLAKVPSAANADTAVNAANAGTVDGKNAVCAAGTTPYLGQCFETTARAAATSVFAASDDCADEGRYLPNPLQLRTFGLQADITLAAPSEYSDAVYQDDDGTVLTFKVLTVSEIGLTVGEPFTDDRPYRCVAPLVG